MSTREFAYAAVSGVDLSLITGSVRVALDPRASQVCLTISGSGADAAVIERRHDVIVVRTSRSTGFLSSNGTVTVSITGPDHVAIRARLASANVSITGTAGAVDLTTGSGDITIESVSGAGFIKSGSGNVAINDIEGPLDAKCGSGDIAVGSLGPGSRLVTGSGDIEISSAQAPTHLKSGSGSLHLSTPRGPAQLASASGTLRITDVEQGEFRLHNVSGDIHVELKPGTPLWTDISTRTGRLRSSLPALGAPHAGADYARVVARSVTGDIHLRHATHANDQE